MNSDFIIIHLGRALCASFSIQKWSLLSVCTTQSVKGKVEVEGLSE